MKYMQQVTNPVVPAEYKMCSIDEARSIRSGFFTFFSYIHTGTKSV